MSEEQPLNKDVLHLMSPTGRIDVLTHDLAGVEAAIQAALRNDDDQEWLEWLSRRRDTLKKQLTEEQENRMSNQSPFTDEFLTQVRETYQKSKPVLDELMPETAQVQKYFTAFRYVLELQPPQPGADTASLLSWLTRLDGVLTKSSSVMTMLSGVAQSVNGVMSEHEESRER